MPLSKLIKLNRCQPCVIKHYADEQSGRGTVDKSFTTKILIPSGALGLGYDRDALMRGIELQPDLIAIDGGSTDSGPHYLGTGTSKYSRSSIKSNGAN